MNRPLISAIIPVFNGERYLAAALESIFAQDYEPFEVIVVDDGSVDQSAAIARAYASVRYVYQENQGHAVAKNTGIAAAAGEFVAFLDADDMWTPNKLSAQAACFVAQPEAGYSIARQRFFLEPGAQWPAGFNKEFIATEPLAFIPSALMVRRGVFAQIGVFDPHYQHGNDTDWFFRAKEAGIPLATVQEVLLLRRFHESNLSHDTQGMKREMMKILKASLDRRRKPEPVNRDEAQPDD